MLAITHFYINKNQVCSYTSVLMRELIGLAAQLNKLNNALNSDLAHFNAQQSTNAGNSVYVSYIPGNAM